MSNKSTAGAAGRPVAPQVDPATPAPDAPAPAAERATPITVNEHSPNITKNDTPSAPAGNGAEAKLELVKVKTKDDIILMDPFTARHIDRDGAEVPVTTFITDELAEGGRLEKA